MLFFLLFWCLWLGWRLAADRKVELVEGRCWPLLLLLLLLHTLRILLFVRLLLLLLLTLLLLFADFFRSKSGLTPFAIRDRERW